MKFSTFVSLMAMAVATATTGSAGTPISGTGTANPDLIDFEQMEYDAPVPSDFSPGSSAVTPLLSNSIGQNRTAASFTPTKTVQKSFEGISQYDAASYSRNFIPPDTMGSVGATQFTQFANGGFAVFEKDGTVRKAESDTAFWAAAGQIGTNGDSRVRFDAAAGRWIALSFGASVSDIQIAVSKTANAAGAWQSVKLTGFAGGTADYPTLAFDTNAVYIGTNDFNGNGSFGGTTLNVIPLSSLVSAAAPTVAGLKQFVTPYSDATGGYEGGYAIQGVNSQTPSTSGKVLAESLFYDTNVTFDITNVGTAAAQKVNGTYIGGADYNFANPGRQPNAIPDANPNADFANNDRVIDTLDPRIGSSVYEVNGLI